MNIAQLASITGIGVDLLSNILSGGGGGGGPTTPYVSPFGAGPNIGGLASRTQINPNITDYEKYGFGPEAQFFSGGQGGLAGTGTGTATPTVTKDTPYTGGTLMFPEGTSSGVTPPATPATTTTTAPATGYAANLRNPDIAAYKTMIDKSLSSFYQMGQMTDQQLRDYQQKTYDAINAPGATIETVRAALPVPQYTTFNKPTGTPAPTFTEPYTYTAPTQPITDPNRYVNDLYKQLAASVSTGILSSAAAQDIQSKLRQNLTSAAPSAQSAQSIFDTAMQQYKPLI